MKTHTETVIEHSDWNDLVMKTYGRQYCFQQQDGCRERGVERFTVPSEADDGYMNDSVPEEVNHETRGVKFSKWLERDPKQKLPGQEADYELRLWWNRNFYPDFQTLVNDLHAKGLLAAGDYTINIDW